MQMWTDLNFSQSRLILQLLNSTNSSNLKNLDKNCLTKINTQLLNLENHYSKLQLILKTTNENYIYFPKSLKPPIQITSTLFLMKDQYVRAQQTKHSSTAWMPPARLGDQEHSSICLLGQLGLVPNSTKIVENILICNFDLM